MTTVAVHHRRVIESDGHTLLEEVVDCPRDGHIRRLAACASCGYAEGLLRDELDGEDAVLCHSEETSEEPATFGVQRVPRSTLLPGVSVADACERDVICAVSDAPIASVTEALREYAVGTIVIVDAGRAPLGVVSAQDILTMPTGARFAAEAMTSRPINVPVDYPLGRAAALMAFEGIHHLPVVGPGGRLLGILSSIDILRLIGLAEGMIVPERTARRRVADRER